ncbi:MAG: hypothetical protein SV760_04255 [Halobacteria archaeon]|nr:hypothetical protein [Halobacteria archaeon]
MKRLSLLGLLLAAAGLTGYVSGIYVDYTGRAFSVTAVMLGVTLVTIGAGTGGENPEGERPGGQE